MAVSGPDVVIVGAGAAGIGAGMRLKELGVPFVIVEAADRVGGRAFTDARTLPVAWDHGCQWLHCADVNPLVPWADRLGARYLRQLRGDDFRYWQDGGWVSGGEARIARAETTAAFAAVYAAAERGADVPISSVLPESGRWSAGVRMILQLMASDDPEHVSAAAYGDYDDTDVNWPVVSGLGELIARMAVGLPVRLGTPVTGIRETAGGVRVETGSGTIAARAAIVTVSSNVLAADAIRFRPGPAQAVLDAIGNVPCGAYEKVAFAFRRPIPDAAGALFCAVDPGSDGPPVDFQVADPDGLVLIGHVAGSIARDLSAQGPEAMRAFMTDRLCLGFGTGIRDEIAGTAVTGWRTNPWIRGGYSYARPGHAGTRRAMIAAETGRIAFAGEAFSLRWQATVHGAWQSGRDTAERLVRQGLPGRPA